MTARFADRGVDVVPDRTLELTGVVVETRSGAVDGSIEAQLNKVERSMLALTGE
jgi:flagellar biosynthesis/type III secretory pathway protein FliH